MQLRYAIFVVPKNEPTLEQALFIMFIDAHSDQEAKETFDNYQARWIAMNNVDTVTNYCPYLKKLSEKKKIFEYMPDKVYHREYIE